MQCCVRYAAIACLPVLSVLAACQPSGRSVSATRPADNVVIVEERWPNGTLRLRKEALKMPAGTLVEHGAYTQWYDNGQKEYEATYVHGALHGVETAWHKNGQKRTEQHYVHGKRHGPRYAWDPAGRKRKEEHYFDDQPDGTWTVWNADGKVKWQGRFDHGTPLP